MFIIKSAHFRLRWSPPGTQGRFQVREKIYEPFFTTKDRGTGIGLSVVRDIVQHLGGTIDVWSEPEKGTHFEIGLKMMK